MMQYPHAPDKMNRKMLSFNFQNKTQLKQQVNALQKMKMWHATKKQ